MLRVSVIEMRAEALIREELQIKEVLAAHFLSQTFSKGRTSTNLLPCSPFHLITATVIFSNLLKLASSLAEFFSSCFILVLQLGEKNRHKVMNKRLIKI